MFQKNRQCQWKWSVLAVMILLNCLNAGAWEEDASTTKLDTMVVSATRSEISSKYIASSITVITAEDIERKGQTTIYDALKDVPGLALSQCGGPGQYTTVRMRGGQDRHIKLMINGSAIGDPATGITPHYDLWNFLTTDDIERIEIIRGAQSALYGSDAVSGIINIITKKGKGTPKAYIKGVAGGMETFKASAGLKGGYGNLGYNINLSHNDAGGVFSHDEFESDTISTRFSYTFTQDTNVDISAQYTDSTANLSQSDTKTWQTYDDPRNFRYGKLFFSNMNFNQKLTSFWEHKISIGYDRVDKNTEDMNDGILNEENNIKDSWKTSDHLGVTTKTYWQNNFFLGEMDTLTAGIEYEDIDVDRENVSSTSVKKYSDTIETKSIYLQNQLFLMDESLSLICGGRLDDHSNFGEHTTFRIGVSYLVRKYGTKLKATYGTGFAPPSVFNLADPQYGNPDLEPEESKSWDMGFEQRLFNDKAKFEATYFHNDYDDLIAYDSSLGYYVNRETSKSYGVESRLSIFPTDHISMALSYTYTDGEEDGKDLARIPRDDWKLNLSYTSGKFMLNADFYYVGDRLAYDQLEAHRMDSYTLVNISGNYQINKKLNMFVQIDNLFDEEYQTSAPYDAPGISAYAGMKLAFSMN